MAGFLDKKDRIIDFSLTSEGKSLLSKGKLNFVYYSFSDDEVEYQPFIENSSSLSLVELTASSITQTESSLVREVTTGHLKVDKMLRDRTNINNLLFSMPQGQINIPTTLINPNVESGSIKLKQRKVIDIVGSRRTDGGYERFDSTNLVFELSVENLYESNKNKGFIVKILKSGSDGFIEVNSKRDFAGNISYMNDLILLADDDI